MLKQFSFTAIKGLVIGGTMLVPGVSGGSMAMILGIYQKLISAISSFWENKKKYLIFLLLFSAGAVLGMVLFAKPLLRLIDTFPLPTMYFFIGAVAGGVPMICRQAEIKAFSFKIPLYILLGAAIVVGISVIPAGTSGSQSENWFFSAVLLILAGLIAAVALILPGISVSYLLLLLGLYDKTMQAISEFYMPFLIPLAIGLIVGIIAATKLLERAMDRHPQPTYLMILGFILGSIFNIFPGIPSLPQAPVCLLTFAAGFTAIYFLSKKEAQGTN